MLQIVHALWNDDAGFIVSAELVLIATIAVLSLVVGLSEVAYGINQELEDVGSAIASLNQTYQYNGVAGHKGSASGSSFYDQADHCDGESDIVCNVYATGEAPAWNH